MRPPLMIFAAGLGTRMRPLTDTCPKPLIKVGGQTLLDRAIALGRDAGLAHIAVNSHYLSDRIATHLEGSGISISDERDCLLDTGGGLRRALPLLGNGPVATLNPDVVWSGVNPLTQLLDAWDEGMDALLALVPLGNATARLGAGDFAMAGDGRISRHGDFVYGGAQIIRPDLLDRIPDKVFSLNRLWDMMIARGRAFGVVHTGGWCDVGRPDAIAQAEDMLSDA